MSLGDRIFPVVTEVLGKAFEQNPFIAESRRKLVAPAHGRVLEVGAGTGFNLPYYPSDVTELVLADPLDGMLSRARRRADRLGRRVETARLAGEDLPDEDASFDTVVASLVLCSVDDQDEVLAEIRRVLRPGGSYLFLEHVRSHDPKLARHQDRLEGVWGVIGHGCHPNRDTLARIEARFDVPEVERGVFPSGPKLVRPYILGRATRAAGSVERSRTAAPRDERR